MKKKYGGILVKEKASTRTSTKTKVEETSIPSNSLLTSSFSPYSLTYLEQVILTRLLYASSAMNSWELYRKVVGSLSIATSEEDEKSEVIARKRALKNKIKEDVSGHLIVSVPHDKSSLSKYVAKEKKKGKDIPHYQKFLRIIEDMVAIGWVGKRSSGVGKAKAFYYIDGEVRHKMSVFNEAKLEMLRSLE